MSQTFADIHALDGSLLGGMWFQNTSDFGYPHLYTDAHEACEDWLKHTGKGAGAYERATECEKAGHPLTAGVVQSDYGHYKGKPWSATVCLTCRVIHEGTDPFNQANDVY